MKCDRPTEVCGHPKAWESKNKRILANFLVLSWELVGLKCVAGLTIATAVFGA